MRRIMGISLFFILLGISAVCRADATVPCVLDQGRESYDLRPFMSFLEDPGGSLTIHQVASPGLAARFAAPPAGHFNFGFTSSALWFRFAIVENPPVAGSEVSQGRLWIFDPGWHLYDTFELFVPDAGSEGGWRVYSAGRLLSVAGGQENRHFRLPTGLRQPAVCYIRVTGIRPIVLAPRIATFDWAMRSNGFKMLGTALLLGFFGTLMLGNLAIFIYTRDKRFSWFVLANASFTAFVAVSSYQFLYMHERIPTLIMITGLVSQGSLALVARAFLETRRGSRGIDSLLFASTCLVFASAALAFFLPDQLQGKLSLYALTPLSLVMVWACLDNLKRDRAVSFIFLSAWVLASVNIAVYTLAARGVLPFVHPSMIWGGLVVLAFAMAVLLAHSIRTMAVKRQAALAMAQARSAFLASMSHEIRTPMTAVLGFVNLSLQSGAGGQLRQYLLKVWAAARHLMAIINDILDVAKIEAGKIELECKAFELEALLQATGDFLAPLAIENRDELVFYLGAGVPRRLVGDPLRLQQVLVNLGNNAVKFTQGGTVRIVVDRGEADHPLQGRTALRFQIIDTGIGIDERVLPRLFQSFEQADSSTARVYGGTGLGLNISRRLVQLMGGDITVRSTIGQGSTFEFKVEFGTADDGAQEGGMSHMEPRVLDVLIIEDNPFSRDALEEIFGRLGVRWRTAASMSEAVRLLGTVSFDLILLDRDMPGPVESDALSRLRGMECTATTPIVLMANLAHPEMEGLRIEQSEAQAVLGKPFTPSAVVDAVRNAFAEETVSCDAGPEAECSTLDELNGMRILLVEDNLFNQELISEILGPAGVELEIADNGQDALSRIADQSRPGFDVVLMDVQMPGMDGYEATRRIRADKRFDTLPVIAMTADVMAEDRARCLETGMNGHLSKPVDTEELFRTLFSWGRAAGSGRSGIRS